MKINSIETVHLRHPLSRPAGPASVLNDTRECLLLRIGTDEGLYGWGEAVPFAGIREQIVDGFGPRLLGKDPLDVRRTWRNRWLAPFESGLALGAVDVALHDLWGKVLGVPIHQLYGGAYRRAVPGYASAGLYLEGVDPADHWFEEAAELVERGFKAIKIRMGRFSPEHELPLVEKLRAAVPADVKLMVDAWGSYTLPTALRVGRVLQDLNFYWYEEPLPQDGYRAYEILAAELDIAIAGGENVQTRWAAKELLDKRAVDILQPDVSICGGLADFIFMAELAHLYGIRCLPHSFNSGITAAASLQAASLLPDPTLMPGVDTPMMEYDTTENLFIADLLVEPLAFKDGFFELPSGPGLGVDVDEDFVSRYRIG